MFEWMGSWMMSAHTKRSEQIARYVEGGFSAKERADFEKKMLADSQLQAEVEALRQLRAELRALPRLPVPRNFTLDPALYGKPAPAYSARAYPIMRGATALASLIFIIALFFTVIPPQTKGMIYQADSEIASAPLIEPILVTVAMAQSARTPSTTLLESNRMPEEMDMAMEETPPPATEVYMSEIAPTETFNTLAAEAMQAPTPELLNMTATTPILADDGSVMAMGGNAVVTDNALANEATPFSPHELVPMTTASPALKNTGMVTAESLLATVDSISDKTIDEEMEAFGDDSIPSIITTMYSEVATSTSTPVPTYTPFPTPIEGNSYSRSMPPIHTVQPTPISSRSSRSLSSYSHPLTILGGITLILWLVTLIISYRLRYDEL